jgi:SAM-dependent methyltransferase
MDQIRLDICGGAYPLGEGFINVDIKAIPGVNIVADITRSLPFRSDSVDEIASCGTLEHFTRSELEAILREFLRVIKKGGLLKIGVPDLQRIINAYALGTIDHEVLNQYLYGRGKDEYDLHRTAFDFEWLFELLKDTGFSKIRKVPYAFPFHIPSLMMQVECLKDPDRGQAQEDALKVRGETPAMDEMEFTGERLVPTDPHLHDLYVKHVSRYIFASRYVKDGAVLDAGCGCGYGSHTMALSGARYVTGIDNSLPTIDFCRRYYSQRNVTFFPADCLAMPFKNNTFDQVVSFEVLEHVTDYRQYLNECHRVLKPDGLFVVSTPNKRIFEKTENPFHIKEFYLEEFEFALKERFEVIDILGQEISPAYAVQSENQQAVYTFLATMINYYEELFKYTERQLGVLRDTAQQQAEDIAAHVEATRDEIEFLFKQMPFFVFKAFFPPRLRFFFPGFIRRWIKSRIQAKIDFYWNHMRGGREAHAKDISFSREHPRDVGRVLRPLTLKERIRFPVATNRKKLSRPPIATVPLSRSDMVIRKENREQAPYLIALCGKYKT